MNETSFSLLLLIISKDCKLNVKESGISYQDEYDLWFQKFLLSNLR